MQYIRAMLFDRSKYFLGVFIGLFVYPIMYMQAKKIRRDFPDLPEAKEPQGEAGQGPKLNLLLMGESSIAGVGVEVHSDSICGQIADELARLQACHVNWQVVAKSGYTAEKVLKKLVKQVPDESFDLIVIGLGGNDTFQVSTPWFWKRSMLQLVEALHEKQPQAKIAVTCMPPVHTFTAFPGLLKFFLGGLTKLHGREVRRLARRLDYLHYFDYVITLEDWIGRYEAAKEPDDFFSDGVHPSALTYEIWGKETAQFLHRSVL